MGMWHRVQCSQCKQTCWSAEAATLSNGMPPTQPLPESTDLPPSHTMTCRRCKLHLPPTQVGQTGVLSQVRIRDLQSRDIRPEDYDLLLTLDEGISRPSGQTMSKEECDRLPRLDAPQDMQDVDGRSGTWGWEGETCAICCEECREARMSVGYRAVTTSSILGALRSGSQLGERLAHLMGGRRVLSSALSERSGS